MKKTGYIQLIQRKNFDNSNRPYFMQMNKLFTIASLCATFFLFALTAQAANVIKADNANNLNDPAAWVGAATPTASDIAVWNNTVQVNSTSLLGADTNWAGIKILDPALPITISAGNKLTLGASGIDMSLATNSFTMANTVSNNAAQTWNVAAGQTLTAGGTVSGPTTSLLTKTGNGTLIMGVANTYSSGTILNGGTLRLNAAAGAGTGGLTNQNGTTLRYGSALTVVNLVDFSGTSFVDMNNNSGSMLLNGSWTGGGTVIVTNSAPGTTFTIGGNGNGGGNMNGFTGAVVYASTTSLGNFSTNNLRLNDSGGNNNTGNTNASFDLGGGFITLTTRNRSGSTINLGSLSGGTNSNVKIGSSGSGGTTYSVGAKNIATTFAGILDGTGTTAGMFLALAKAGTNIFTLTGANTYNGATTISGGTLQIGNGGTSGQLGTGNVINNAALLFNRSDDITVANNISGSGTVTKINPNILTFTGTNSSSGSTIINQGSLVLGTVGLMSCPVFVASGATFDVSQNPAFTLGQTLSGSGTVTGLVTSVGGTISPGGSGAAGTLSFSNGVTESGSVNNQMELSSVGSTNDLINIVGDLTLSATNNINLTHFGGGAIPSGTYTLINYSGNLNGGLNNFAVIATGNNGILTNPPNQIAVIISPSARGVTNLTWIGDGGANAWDITTSNWINGATSFAFLPGDSVRFDSFGAANPTVNLVVTALPSSVVVSNTTAYTITGNGSISGSTGLIKTNSGTLNLLTTNSYTGPTIIGGGTLAVSYLANSGSSSAIGAASGNPTNLVLFGTTLSYMGANASSDRGATLNGSGGTFDVIGGTILELDGTIAGAGALTKFNTGTLTINNAVLPNTYSSGTIISNGVLALGGNNANSSGLGTGSVTFYSGTLQLFGYTGSNANHYNALNNPLVVPFGQTGTLQMFSRGPTDNTGITSPLTGGGILNLVVNFQRASIDGDWSAFTGLINVTANSGADHFRVKNTYGFVSAAIFLNDGVSMYCNGTANSTIDIGELGGTSLAFLGLGTVSQNNAVANPTWRVGAKNTTNTFAGVIRDDTHTSIVKVGTGSWILSGQNTFTGSTTVSNGVLALTNNSVSLVDGSIGSSTNISIMSGAFLDVSGRSDGTMPLNSSQVISGNGTLRGVLDTTAGGTVSPGGGITGGIGTLIVTNSINLGGTAWMKLNRASSPNSDRLASSLSGINYGGTLVVTNVGAGLHVNDTFTLFSGTGYTNAFGTLSLPTYYTWNTSQLNVNGTISVATVLPPPAITNVDFSQLVNGTITLNAVNGALNGPVTVLTSTNVALPLSSWTTVTTTTFDGSGNLTLPVTVNPAAPQQYFILLAY